MALTNKLTAIADAIRGKTGKTDALTLDQMPIEIDSISTATEILLKPSEYPDYVRTEINRVADEVRQVLTADSIVSICLSDSHYPADENTRLSNLHAMMAIKGLTYLLPVDFIAHLGDVGFEASNVETNTDRLESNLIEMLSYIKESNGDSIPLFVAIGNHDPGVYITTSNDSDMIGGDYLYNNFTALSASNNTVFSGEANGGYCYRDFPDKKLRVFLLNTSEGIITGGYDNDNGASQAQLAWFASKLKELNTKSDASNWGIIVLCHYPADFGGARPLSNTIAAYINGTTISLNGTIYDFSGSNSARFIVQHHGHVHNFIYDKLYSGNTPTQYDGWRVGIPNTQDSRENYYGIFNGVQYSEETNQTKVPGTVEDTSFVVNVINPSTEDFYSFYYGKGYNRSFCYTPAIYYNVTNNLSAKVSTSNSSILVPEGSIYTATITILDGYRIKNATVTMGGEDITSSAYSNGVITISSVTGDIVITITTSGYTNMIPLSTTTLTGTELYNPPYGFKTATRLNSSAVEKPSTYLCCTGYIPLNKNYGGDVIRIKNITFSPSGGYDVPYFMVFNQNNTICASLDSFENSSDDRLTLENIDGVYTITVHDSDYLAYGCRLSCGVIDSTSIITINEEIED